MGGGYYGGVGTMIARFRLIRREPKSRHERGDGIIFPFVLVCDEDNPVWVEHDHNHGGHGFPCTKEDLLLLLQQIEAALGASG